MIHALSPFCIHWNDLSGCSPTSLGTNWESRQISWTPWVARRLKQSTSTKNTPLKVAHGLVIQDWKKSFSVEPQIKMETPCFTLMWMTRAETAASSCPPSLPELSHVIVVRQGLSQAGRRLTLEDGQGNLKQLNASCMASPFWVQPKAAYSLVNEISVKPWLKCWTFLKLLGFCLGKNNILKITYRRW